MNLWMLVVILAIQVGFHTVKGENICFGKPPCVCCESGYCSGENTTSCEGCIPGYTGRDCTESCPENCISCSQTFHDSDRECYKCKDGSYNGRYQDVVLYPELKDCSLSCRTGCASCAAYDKCNKCEQGYYTSGTKCIKCPSNCVSCLSELLCTKCRIGFYGENCFFLSPLNCFDGEFNETSGKCLSCANGYSMSKSGLCVKCPDDCAVCTAGYCLACKEGFKGEYCQEVCSDCKPGAKCNKYHRFCLDCCPDGQSGKLCSPSCEESNCSITNETRGICNTADNDDCNLRTSYLMLRIVLCVTNVISSIVMVAVFAVFAVSKPFRTLLSPAFSEKDIHFYLSRAREMEAEESRKRKVVKNTFRESVQAATREEAVESFPNHTKEATLEPFCDYPQSQTMIPKQLAHHINSALQDLPPPVNIQDTIEVVIRRNGKTIITTTEMALISNQVKS